MSNLKELKTQIETANALGIKNLNEKGVGLFASGNITTYQIMGAISLINVGGGGITYTNIVYNEDDTITLTDKDGIEHTMECEYTDGKLTSVKYDGKAVELIYDGDVLVKVGKTEIDVTNVKTSGGQALDHTVTFKVDDEPYQIVSVKDGNSVSEPPQPTSENGSFDSWRIDGTKISFPYTPTTDTDITALLYDGAYQLYTKFDVSKEEYPYILITLGGMPSLWFLPTLETVAYGNPELIHVGVSQCVMLTQMAFRDISSLTSVCEDILNDTTVYKFYSSSNSSSLNENSYVYTNGAMLNLEGALGHWVKI